MRGREIEDPPAHWGPKGRWAQCPDHEAPELCDRHSQHSSSGGAPPARPPPTHRGRRVALTVHRLLTHGQPHQAVGEEAGGEEGGPQRDVQLLGDLRLHPHEQAGEERGGSAGGGRSLDAAGQGLTTYFLIFSKMSAILPKRFCVKKQLWSRHTPGATGQCWRRPAPRRPRPAPRSPWSCPAAPRPRTG